MRYLKTNTATRITVGPFLDKTDGITPETALTVTGIKLTFVVDDGGVPTLVLDTNPTASGGNNDMVHITNDDAGFYDLELTAANVNYVGRAMIALTDAANHCPVFHEFTILPALVYDSLIGGTDNLQVDTIQVGGTSQTAGDIIGDTNDIQARLPATLVSGRMDSSVGAMAANVVTAAAIADGAIDAATFAAGAITATVIATDAIDNDAIAANAVTEIQSGLSVLTQADIRTAIGLSSADLDTQLGNMASDVSIIDGNLNDYIGGMQLVTRTAVGGTGNDATHVHLEGLPYGDDELNNHLLVIFDLSVAEYHARWIDDWVNSTALATVATLPFTPVGGDVYYVLSLRRDVTASVSASDIRSAIGLTSANLDTQLSGIQSDTDNIQTRIPAALTAGGNIKADALLLNGATPNNISTAQVNSEVDTALSDVGLTTTITGRIDAAVSSRSSHSAADVWAVGTRALTDKADFSLSSAGIQAIWDALTSALSTVSSIGKLLVDNINATISSRLASASYTAPDNTSITAIKSKTDNLPIDPADASDIASSFTTVNTKLDTIDDFLDTEVAAIKAKTDNLPTDPADESLLEAAITSATSGLSTLTQANVRTAVGLASANLDTQLDALPTAAENADAVWDELKADHVIADSFGDYLDDEITSRATSADVPSAATIATTVWANATRTLTAISDSTGITTLLSRIASALNISSGKVEANIKQVNDVTLTGDGDNTPWGPA